MSWFNRILGCGLGFFFGGGPLGAMVGLAIGHLLDKAKDADSEAIEGRYNRLDSMQMAFFAAIFSLLAKIAKADGRISEQEGRYLLKILDEMKLQGELRQFAIATFNQAKDTHYTHLDFARQLRQITSAMPAEYGSSTGILQQLFYTLVSMAARDGHISRAEDLVLREIAAAFGFSETLIRQAYSQIAGYQNMQVDTCYEVLGLSPSASDEEVRTAYRQLVKETHPDKLVQQGLPPEMKDSAEKRFREIQEAWQHIRQQRGLA